MICSYFWISETRLFRTPLEGNTDMTENCLRTSTKAKVDFQVEITTNSPTDLGFFSTSNAYGKRMILRLITMVKVILIDNGC